MARQLRRARQLVVLIVLALGACQRSGAKPDREFDVSVATPAYVADGPVVLIDEEHHNIHTATGTYAPFADLVRNDGYEVRRGRDPISASALADVDIVVIANALGTNDRNDDHALTDAECDRLLEWVRQGGGLLLITDHYPTGSAVGNLAARLGVSMSGGITEDSTASDERFDASHIVYRRFPDHPVTGGLQRVITFTGQSLGVPAGGTALLPLGDHAIDRPATPRVEHRGSDVLVHVEYGEGVPARGRAQAIAFELGKGRVAVLAEAAMVSAQLSSYDGSPFGMNVAGYDNRQFALNVMHWLSRHIVTERGGSP
jgi:hypothetical protein